MSSTFISYVHDHELPAVAILAHLRWWADFDLQSQSVVDNLKKVVLLYGPGKFTLWSSVIQTSVRCLKRSLMSSCLLTAIQFGLIRCMCPNECLVSTC